MDLHAWPPEFFERKDGVDCPQCIDGRTDRTAHGIRFSAGEVSDSYLQRKGPVPGYAVVVFRSRHVGALHEFTADEHRDFWSEVGVVAQAIERAFRPVHINYQVLGNTDPQVHVHIVPRYDPDPAPLFPLPSSCWDSTTEIVESEIARQILDLNAVAETLADR